MGKDDQEKMEALLLMRNMCDDNSVGSSSPYRSKPAAVNHNRGGRPPSRLGGPVPLSSPVRLGGPVAPTSQLRKNRTVSTKRKERKGFCGALFCSSRLSRPLVLADSWNCRIVTVIRFMYPLFLLVRGHLCV